MKITLISGEHCKPCQTFKPVLKQFCTENHIELQIIDVNEADELIDRYNIRSIPTIIYKGKIWSGTMTTNQLNEFLD